MAAEPTERRRVRSRSPAGVAVTLRVAGLGRVVAETMHLIRFGDHALARYELGLLACQMQQTIWLTPHRSWADFSAIGLVALPVRVECDVEVCRPAAWRRPQRDRWRASSSRRRPRSPTHPSRRGEHRTDAQSGHALLWQLISDARHAAAHTFDFWANAPTDDSDPNEPATPGSSAPSVDRSRSMPERGTSPSMP